MADVLEERVEPVFDQHAFQRRVLVLSEKFRTARENQDQLLDPRLSTLLSAAALLSEHDQQAEVEKMRVEVIRMAEAAHEIALGEAAMQELRNNFRVTASVTDFDAELAGTIARLREGQRFNPRLSEQHRAFQAAIGERPDDVEAQEESDDELEVVRNADNALDYAKNKKCPFSLLDVLDLEHPVEDEKGVVYEEKILKDYARQMRTNVFPCPVLGMTHQVNVNTVKKAMGVLLEKRRRANRRNQAQDGGDDVLEV